MENIILAMKKEEDKDLFLLDYHNVEKAKRMYPKGSLDNHIHSLKKIATAFKALCTIWDENSEARAELKELGLNFSHRKFSPDQFLCFLEQKLPFFELITEPKDDFQSRKQNFKQ